MDETVEQHNRKTLNELLTFKNITNFCVKPLQANAMSHDSGKVVPSGVTITFAELKETLLHSFNSNEVGIGFLAPWSKSKRFFLFLALMDCDRCVDC